MDDIYKDSIIRFRFNKSNNIVVKMGCIVLINIIILFLFAAPALCRDNLPPLNLYNEFLPSSLLQKFPPPPFVQRGFVAVYDTAYRVIKNNKESVSTSVSIYLVNYADGLHVAGSMFLLAQGLPPSFKNFHDVGGFGSFYINPSLLKTLEKNPLPGVEAANQLVHTKTDRLETTTSYNAKGLMSGSRIIRKSPISIERSVVVLKWYGRVKLPPLPSKFPLVVRTAHHYSVSTMLPSWNGVPQEVPFGQLSITPGTKYGKIMEFYTTFQGNPSMNLPEKTTSLGTTLWGSFYMDPKYLATLRPGMAVLSIPAANFFLKVTSVDNRGVRIDSYYNGQLNGYSIYQPSTGLLTMSVEIMNGMPPTVIKLIK